jgi:hypothetical protein
LRKCLFGTPVDALRDRVANTLTLEPHHQFDSVQRSIPRLPPSLPLPSTHFFANSNPYCSASSGVAHTGPFKRATSINEPRSAVTVNRALREALRTGAAIRQGPRRNQKPSISDELPRHTETIIQYSCFGATRALFRRLVPPKGRTRGRGIETEHKQRSAGNSQSSRTAEEGEGKENRLVKQRIPTANGRVRATFRSPQKLRMS